MWFVVEDSEEPTTPVPVTHRPCERPTISKFSSYVKHTVGFRHTKLKCKATGYPEPTISWSPIKQQRRFIDSNLGMLTIKNPRPEDAGVYICTASNKCGQASIETELNVVVGESPELCTIDIINIYGFLLLFKHTSIE